MVITRNIVYAFIGMSCIIDVFFDVLLMVEGYDVVSIPSVIM